MAKTKVETSVISNRLNGSQAVVEFDPRIPRRAIIKTKEVEKIMPKGKKQPESKPPFTTTEPEGIKKAEAEILKKQKTEEKPKAEEKPVLSDKQQQVLEYLKTLDHPATTNEVRDKFGFKLRGNARAIFRKLVDHGQGEMRRVGKRYLFYVKGKEYPKPQKPEPKKTEAKAESKSAKA